MKLALCLAATLTASIASANPSTNPSGYATISFDAPHHGRQVTGGLWYPAEVNGETITIAENPVFHGVTVALGATPRPGDHPVVLLSHGMGGTIRSLAWLASGLAERGAVVLAVNHPNSTWGDFDLAAGLAHWTRVEDLTIALDQLTTDPRFEDHLDSSRIMAAGFSFGGWTALSMGGVTGNHAGYTAHCAAYGETSSHCNDLMGAAISLSAVSDTDWNASYADQRITHVTAIDPGISWGLTEQNVEARPQAVRLIGLGDDASRLLATDFDASGLAGLLLDAQITRIAPAMHFTALPLCKPLAATILVEEQDDPVCSDPDGTNRAAVHGLIIETIAADLDLMN